MQLCSHVRGVNINNLTCSNMWAGIAPNLPDSATFGDFTIGNSQFSKIGTDAISTYGQWKIIQTDYSLGPEECHLLHFHTWAAAKIKNDLIFDLSFDSGQ